MDNHDSLTETERAARLARLFAENILSRIRPAVPRRISITTPERHHPWMAPKKDEHGYYEYLKKLRNTMLIAVTVKSKRLAQDLQGFYTTIVESDRLTVEFTLYSQSKLSQQDLAELQKATKFDKKELQQWYKGETLETIAPATLRRYAPCAMRHANGALTGHAQDF
jgi:hypothetical protein